MDSRLHQLLAELRGALHDAISDSAEVHRHWRKLRDDGYSLYLMVDCKRHDDEDESVDRSRVPMMGDEPVFQINGVDLSFLRSIGIDPTRRAPRRRSS